MSLLPYRDPLATGDNSRSILPRKLINNPPTEAQHSVLVQLDNSASMNGEAIDQLKAEIPRSLTDLRAVAAIRSSALMQFAIFGDDTPFKICGPFMPVADLRAPPLPTTGSTPLCECIEVGINLLVQARKYVRQQFHVDQKHSWYIVFTDGAPGDFNRASAARDAIRKTALENKIDVFLYGCGESANMEFLHSIEQPGRPAERLTSSTNFKDLFAWLGRSLREVSQRAPGESFDISSPNGNIFRTQ
jgi:uncharacterized protein YegL